MDPYDLNPGVDFTLHEMDRMNRLTDELERIDRLANPLKYKVAELNVGIEDMVARVDSTNRLISEVQQIERIRREIEPITTQSLIAAQEAVSKVIKEAVALPQITPEESMRRLDDLRFPVNRFDVDLPEFDFPKGQSLSALQQMSDEEIHAFLDDNPAPIAALKGLHELMKRHLNQVTRPHWSVSWTFWLVVASLIAALINIALMLK